MPMMMEVTEMDVIREVLCQAHYAGMSLIDVIEASLEAGDVLDFAEAVDLLELATPQVCDTEQ